MTNVITQFEGNVAMVDVFKSEGTVYTASIHKSEGIGEGSYFKNGKRVAWTSLPMYVRNAISEVEFPVVDAQRDFEELVSEIAEENAEAKFEGLAELSENSITPGAAVCPPQDCAMKSCAIACPIFLDSNPVIVDKKAKYPNVKARTKRILDMAKKSRSNLQEKKAKTKLARKIARTKKRRGKERECYAESLFVGLGNDKLDDIHTWSLPPIATCVHASKNCIMKCYGFKNYYDSTSLAFTKNWELSKEEKFVELMLERLIEIASPTKMKNEALGQNNVEFFRIHVTGDFYSQKYFEAWVKITDMAKKLGLPIEFGCYTKAVKFVNAHLEMHGKKLSDININFMFSLWNDTKIDDIQLAEKLDMNVYAVTLNEEHENSLVAKGYKLCDDIAKKDEGNKVCGVSCFDCYQKTEGRKLIFTPLH